MDIHPIDPEISSFDSFVSRLGDDSLQNINDANEVCLLLLEKFRKQVVNSEPLIRASIAGYAFGDINVFSQWLTGCREKEKDINALQNVLLDFVNSFQANDVENQKALRMQSLQTAKLILTPYFTEHFESVPGEKNGL